MQYNSILEVLIFQMDYKFQLKLCPNITKLEFYDPEYNMEYLNRLFNVLGIINNVYIVDNEEELERAQKGFKGIIEEDNYYTKRIFEYIHKMGIKSIKITNQSNQSRAFSTRPCRT